jgi:para-nitrobenzyl esterase
VCCLLASPLASGLFHRAIPMSGGCDTNGSLEDGYEQGMSLAKEMGCEGPDVVACLRAKPAEDFVPEGGILTFLKDIGDVTGSFPHVDGYVQEGQPIECIREGNYNQVPVMVGHTRDEIRLFTMVIPGLSLLPRFAINKAMRYVFKDKTDRIMELYSYSDYKHPAALLLAVANDAFISRGYDLAEVLAERGNPVYLYRFDWDEIRFPDKMGSFHGLDIPFVFGNQDPESRISRILRKRRDYEQGPMYWQIMYYYTNFAMTGDPNGQGLKSPGPEGLGELPEWPGYSIEQKQRIYLDTLIKAEPLDEEDIERYEFFSSQKMQDLL